MFLIEDLGRKFIVNGVKNLVYCWGKLDNGITLEGKYNF